MTTAVISDLHLGSGASCLTSATVRKHLHAALTGVDRLVLLGDVLALRGGRLHDVLARAVPTLQEIVGSMGGREVVFVPGNHDHVVAERLLEERARSNGRPTGLQIDSSFATTWPALLGSEASDFADTGVTVAYPGIRLRPDVYATHGHYLDCHVSVPRLEAVLASAMVRLRGGLPGSGVGAEHYESALAPLYAFAYRHAQGDRTPGAGLGRSAVWRHVRTAGWRQLESGTAAAVNGRPRRSLALPAAVALINRAGLGPFQARQSPAGIGEAGFRAIGQVASRLEIDAEHVLFGHTHRAGPMAGEGERRSPSGSRLVNTGCWTYSRTLIGGEGPSSPYWPGTCVFVDDDGPPRVERLLLDVPLERIR